MSEPTKVQMQAVYERQRKGYEASERLVYEGLYQTDTVAAINSLNFAFDLVNETSLRPTSGLIQFRTALEKVYR